MPWTAWKSLYQLTIALTPLSINTLRLVLCLATKLFTIRRRWAFRACLEFWESREKKWREEEGECCHCWLSTPRASITGSTGSPLSLPAFSPPILSFIWGPDFSTPSSLPSTRSGSIPTSSLRYTLSHFISYFSVLRNFFFGIYFYMYWILRLLVNKYKLHLLLIECITSYCETLIPFALIIRVPILWFSMDQGYRMPEHGNNKTTFVHQVQDMNRINYLYWFSFC